MSRYTFRNLSVVGWLSNDGQLQTGAQGALHSPLSFLAFRDTSASMPHDVVEFVVFPRVGWIKLPSPLGVELGSAGDRGLIDPLSG
jgi:hypothetical protein